MPHRRVPRRPSLIGRFGAAVAIVGLLALAPIAASTTYAQGGPGSGMGHQHGSGHHHHHGIVAGQTQSCRELPGAIADYDAFLGPYPTPSWDPMGFPIFASYMVPPYGGYWGFYTGVGPICAWRPH